ncbi:MAG: hypothetical protein S4CHLAM45_05620 [Chlamydiales bacterium]|nr:hypothetical protein [Chlamydiales bacterium]MCH9619897.1 hypothetical protein [Chlamydiales bacterium]MCH9622676.1 hypothetical protein [Chlamydiales bacterium]
MQNCDKCDETLLLQFLLNECLIAQDVLSKSPSKGSLQDLIGEKEDPSTHWRGVCGLGRPIGHLRKLRFYCSLIPPASSIHTIETPLDEALLAAKECQYALHKEEVCPKASFERLKKEMLIFTAKLLEQIHFYEKNGPLLFFLLRKQTAIDRIYGKGTTAKKVLSFFSNGVKEASQFLTHCFSKRGFSHLLPTINKHLDIVGQYEK